ncbi:IQ and ubiquitin-like domain-containing protein isoform X2 [Ornithorhynchus anatinus]|uniref:IQ motif and ubiquitin domain containing n=1 Tax=Ornithorhynchus anatinus TaxID=9258 RepID=F7E391_ORNAN|nr:IQ and ubiquitin-like domain-containing protein isoform X1 [Ornithorhynchus anatinus]XP_028930013.1 IQ and ubiquitin-like domain-containing protein isoform X1 [Ornithorhynchus anatinus]XP_028930015.1 IQ and ubiquitin-like domain-containing protein isoform X1 [Ornithorhynchus anatinus]XP_028930017.1 IQ and ubiquitin-like domain-containing protein isoform X1 [Ornithorhynchus anatinus]XP_028930018.1 IQ and ubiquitin-like domain-containing protein isoform X1 [Ornithorhynchus anatinus]XP_0289300
MSMEANDEKEPYKEMGDPEERGENQSGEDAADTGQQVTGSEAAPEKEGAEEEGAKEEAEQEEMEEKPAASWDLGHHPGDLEPPGEELEEAKEEPEVPDMYQELEFEESGELFGDQELPSTDDQLRSQEPLRDEQQDIGREAAEIQGEVTVEEGPGPTDFQTEPVEEDFSQVFLTKMKAVQEILQSPTSLLQKMTEATATVQVLLIPLHQRITVSFNVGFMLGLLKQQFAKQLNVPHDVLQFTFGGRIIKDNETLMSVGVQPQGTIQLEMFSVNPEYYPIKTMGIPLETVMADVITVRVQADSDTFQDVAVEIKKPTYHKPFLGGYRHKVTGIEFHNAGTQTVPKKIPERTGIFCRETQTAIEKNSIQQTRNTTSTQMTKIGVYVSNLTDKLIKPGTYITADEYHARRLKAVIVIQTYYRRWHAQEVVKNLKNIKRVRLEWEEKEKKRKEKELAEKLQHEYDRRCNPKLKEDFELLYHALEVWRLQQIDDINHTYSGAERKAALCELLEEETQLIASIGEHKLIANEENQRKSIQFFLDKCAAPKTWRSFDGKITEMDTQYTIRAKELRDIYSCIVMKNLSQDERLDVLLTLKHTVKEQECKLTQEILELIDREVDLMMRGVKDCNLEGLRKRITTLFLQYIKTPTFNPEVARILKVPQDPLKLYKNVHFCRSCKTYLPSTEFSISTTTLRQDTHCRQCCKLDNEARCREAYLKFKLLLNNLRKSEINYENKSAITFLIQLPDLQYIVEKIWKCQSALSACNDLYNLTMVRWDKSIEWSPWNCILLTKDEAAAHLNLNSIEEGYETLFIQRIKQKHVLARNHFAHIPEVSSFLPSQFEEEKTSMDALSLAESMLANSEMK